ncbi:hypothetical protein FEDK69T_30890 [Flavobacterium enshiense DK69]|nr:hypothetical protein FEDK69T_30890 [Flavobacterium enshiense DK69]
MRIFVTDVFKFTENLVRKKLLFKGEMQTLTNPKNPKPRHSIKPLLSAGFVYLVYYII